VKEKGRKQTYKGKIAVKTVKQIINSEEKAKKNA
jgi:hypothetical protein